MDEYITLADGTKVAGHVLDGGDGVTIFVYLDNMTVAQGVILFGNQEKTGRIVANRYGEKAVYEGYTELWSADHEYGNCNLVMKKAAGGE